MSKTSRTRSIAAAAALVALLARPSAQQPFRAGVNGVTLLAAVVQGGAPVPGLAAGDFEVRDNGVLQRLTDVSGGQLPLDVTLAVDRSGSITAAEAQALVTAVDRVSAALLPADRCRVLTFADTTTERLAFAHPPVRLSEAGAGSGQTALFDAAVFALLQHPAADRRRLAIVLTDGGEDASFVDGPMLLDAGRYSDVVLSVLRVTPPGMPHADAALWDVQASLAAETGGDVVTLGRDGNPGAAFVRMIEEFRAGYVLRYSASGVAARGWHAVSVTVTRPGRYIVRVRSGYMGVS